jgi:hypothetical protein
MSIIPIIPNNDKRNNLNNIEEALILREIFNIIENKNSNGNENANNKNNDLLEKYKIHNIKFNSNIGINTLSKNRYKIKLRKLFKNKVNSKEN